MYSFVSDFSFCSVLIVWDSSLLLLVAIVHFHCRVIILFLNVFFDLFGKDFKWMPYSFVKFAVLFRILSCYLNCIFSCSEWVIEWVRFCDSFSWDASDPVEWGRGIRLKANWIRFVEFTGKRCGKHCFVSTRGEEIQIEAVFWDGRNRRGEWHVVRGDCFAQER